MASKSALNLNVYSTYYESFFALSVGIRVNKHQLRMESRTNQAPVLCYRDIAFPLQSLKESLAAVCPLLGVHDVARARQGALPLFELDFSGQKNLQKFCKSLNGITSNVYCIGVSI